MSDCNRKSFENCDGRCYWNNGCQSKSLNSYNKFCQEGRTLNKIETYYFKQALIDLGYDEEEIDIMEVEGNLCMMLEKTFLSADYVVETKDNMTFWQTLKLNISVIAQAIYHCIVQLEFSRSPKIIYYSLLNILENMIGKNGRHLPYLSAFLVYFVVLPFYFKNNFIGYMLGTFFNFSLAYGIENFFIYKDHVYSTVDRGKLFNFLNIKNNEVNNYKISLDVDEKLLKAFKSTGYLFQNITDSVVNKEKILRSLLLKEVVSGRLDYHYKFVFYEDNDVSLFVKKDIPVISRISPKKIEEKIKKLEELEGAEGLKYIKFKKIILNKIIKSGCGEDDVPFKNLQETLISYDYIFDTLTLKDIVVLHKNYDYDRIINMADIYYRSELSPISTKNFLVVKIWDSYFLIKGLSRLLTLSLIDIDRKVPCDIIDISNDENKGTNFKKYLRKFFEISLSVPGIVLR